jgi:hypothetical protein
VEINDGTLSAAFYLNASLLASNDAPPVVAVLLLSEELKIEMLRGNQFPDVADKTSVQGEFEPDATLHCNTLEFPTRFLCDGKLMTDVIWNLWHEARSFLRRSFTHA